MATAVQIELMVDEKGAVTGVRTFDTAVKGSAGSVHKLNDELRATGTAGAAGTRAAAAGMKELGGHALTSLDNVRLLRDDFGIHIPRAMEKAIASSKLLSGAIKGIGGALIGFGAIEIGAHMLTGLIDGIKKTWAEQYSLTQATKDYDAELAKLKQQEFGNTHSIETTILRINEATDAAKKFHKESEQALKFSTGQMLSNWHFWVGSAMLPGLGGGLDWNDRQREAHDLQGKSVDAQKQADGLTNKMLPEQQHKRNLDSIELEYTATTHLTDAQRIYNRQLRETAEHAENAAYAQNRDSQYFNPVAAAGASSDQRLQDEKSRREAQGELAEKQRADAQELAHLHEQALEAGLRGSRLYAAQESYAIEELKQKQLYSAAAVADVRLKYHNEEMKRLEDEGREIRKIRGESAAAGKTGTARVQQEGQNKIDEIYATAGTRSSGATLALIDATRKETTQQIVELNKSFKDRVNEIVGQAADRELQGFARIRAEAQNQIRALEADYAKSGGNPDDLKRGKAAIGKSSDDQQAHLAQKNAEETEQIEAEARTKFLSAEKQKTAAIDNEYRQRLLKLKEELKQGEILEDDYNRRVVAAEEQRNAEMVDASREAREKMAGEFDSLFKGLDHPMKMLQQLGDKVAGEAAAALVQRMQGKGAGDAPSTGVGLIDQVFSGFGGGFKIGKHGGNPDKAAEMAHGTRGVGEKTFTLSKATIYVTSATFAGSGGGTGMLAAGGSGATGGFSGGGDGGSGGDGGWGGGTYGSGDFAGGYSSGGNTLGFPGGAGGSAGGAPSNFAGTAVPAAAHKGSVVDDVSSGVGLLNQAGSVFDGNSNASQPGSTRGNPFSASKSGGIFGDLSSGLGLFKQGASTFGGDGNGSQPGSTPGNPFSTNKTGGLLSGNSSMDNISGAAGGALGMYSAVEGTGGFGGAAKGAMSGMQLGMALGGPLGAAVGAAAGAIVGAIGIGGREQARVYDLKTVRPKLTSDQDAYAQGGMNYLDAYSDVQQMIGTSWAVTKKMGPAAEKYWGDTIKPELTQTMGKFTAEERAGRSQYTASSASYAVGTPYVPSDMTAQIHKGEGIFPADQNAVLTRSVGGLADLHSSYKASMSSGSAQRGWGGSRSVNMNVHAIDRKGVADFFDEHKHTMRAALNDSFGENSGGGLS